ncbi:MAG: ABC transporter permease [Candidatus Aminicenantes bacterium]|nr:ABC transporter permease [Candidatus Aminicenantes bacterium]
MLRKIRHIIRKEVIQTFRDRRMLFPIFFAPVIQLIIFGYAATTDIKNISIGILDQDRTEESRTLIASFSYVDYFNVKYHIHSYPEVDELFQKGKIQAAMVIPQKYASNIKKRAKTGLQIILDGTDANSANIILDYISRLVGKQSEYILTELAGKEPEGMIITQPRIWYNPELKSSIYMVPGVICLVLLLTTLILTSMAITKEREMGTLENLIVSPIKTWELIVGKTFPFVIIGLVDMALVILAGRLIFSLPIRGSIFFLFGISLLFILTSLSFGLFISTVSRTQQQAMMSAFFFLMPAMLLSGIFSPIESMPKIIQYITLLNPLRYFAKALRGILLKGNSFSILWPEVLALAAFGIAAIILSSIRFRKYLE